MRLLRCAARARGGASTLRTRESLPARQRSRAARLCDPRAPLKYDSIAVKILESTTANVPIRIERRHQAETGRDHAGATGVPLARVRNVEDEQMLRCWYR